MSLFPNSPLIRNQYNNVPIPFHISNLFKEGSLQDAINEIVNKGYPFNIVYRWISNYPQSLQLYLYKIASSIDTTPAKLQIVVHLYIDVALTTILSVGAFERSTELEKLQKFILSYKTAISYKVAMRSILRSGNPALIAFLALTFQDYETAVSYQAEMKDMTAVFKCLKNLPPNKQRQHLKTIIKTHSMQLLEYIDQASEVDLHPDAFFDALNESLLSLSTRDALKKSSTLIEQTCNVFHNFDKNPIHATIQFIFIINISDDTNKESQRLKAFYQSDAFHIVNHDIVVLYLVDNDKYEIASEVYGRVKNRRINGVTYAFHKSIQTALDLLTKVFPKKEEVGNDEELQKEIRNSWIHLFQLVKELPESSKKDQQVIISAAKTCPYLTVDDFLKFLPKDLMIDELMPSISKSFKKTADRISEAKKLHETIDKRSVSLRNIINDTTPPEPRILDSKFCCFLCHMNISDSRFISYKCGHVVHVSCFECEPSYRYHHKITDPEEMAQSCPQCGTFAMKVIDTPFIDPKRDAREMQLWTI